jgi:hypothetical protein
MFNPYKFVAGGGRGAHLPRPPAVGPVAIGSLWRENWR